MYRRVSSTVSTTLEWIAPRFAEAMADTSNFGPAKTVLSAMQAKGVDLEDRDTVDRSCPGDLIPARGRAFSVLWIP
jgi:hypothetical protein